MAEVDVTINGRSYRIACEDGQENHLMQLAQYLDKRVQSLVETVGQVGDARLLVMAALLVADDLADAHARLEGRGGAADPEPDQAAIVASLERLAERIEGIADRLPSA